MNIEFLPKEKYSKSRKGEVRFGERAYWIESEKGLYEFLNKKEIPFCILGIPEDVGVRANYGRPGAWSAFEPALQTLSNIQDNPYLPSSLCALGIQIRVTDIMKAAEGKHETGHLRELVKVLDARVEEIISLLFSHNKVPIVIGGGHNNALPVLRALFNQSKKKVSVLNIDAHTDLRHTHEGRHSGNSFSCALEEGIIKKYFVLGYHENYIPDYVFRLMQERSDIVGGISMEQLKIRNAVDIRNVIDHLKNDFTEPSGLELDIDCIIHAPSSARTSSGLSAEEARMAVYKFSELTKPSYFHICEAAPVLAHRSADNRTGKLLAFLITDFLKGITA
ncbi:MAG: formimidoylglutamase [Bacteroidia bacterium]|nr:formimidoylglutamase [Bacteroidia bacterium]